MKLAKTQIVSIIKEEISKIKESAAYALAPEMGGYDDKAFLKVAYEMTPEELTNLLRSSQESLQSLNRTNRGAVRAFRRRDAQVLKVRIRYIREILNIKKKDPNFRPDFL